MVSRESIEKAITKSIVETVKCPNSSRAKKIGATGVVSESNGVKTITYNDGTQITLDSNLNEVQDIHMDDVDYNYLGQDKCYNYFQYQKQDLQKIKAEVPTFMNFNMRGGVMDRIDWETEYDFVKTMCDKFATSFGVTLNRDIFYGDKELSHYTGEDHFGSPVVAMDSDVHVNHFFDLARKSRIDHDNLVLVTYTDKFYKEDSLDKLSFTRKGYTSTSVGGDTSDLQKYFKGENGWTVCTVVKKDSGAKGLFFGNPISEARERFHDFTDWEAEVNLPPRTRFTRDIIDEENKIIIQHIERQ